jgi:hypothetical protein
MTGGRQRNKQTQKEHDLMNDITEKLNLNLQVKSIARLLDELGYPDPDDADGDWEPIGPVVRGLTWAALNPQPLPPRWVVELVKRFGPSPDPWIEKEGPHPDPWKDKAGPQPDSWKGALLARFEIDRLVGLAQMVEAIGGEQGRGVVSRRVAEIVDDWCETPAKPRWPFPWPYPFRWRNEEMTIGPADLVVMGVQFHKAAEALSDSALAEDFTTAANRLTQTGLERLNQEANQY